MAQLSALIWLKWTVFRNTMRSRKARAHSLAATLGTLAALALALLVALGLGIAAYSLTSPDARQGAELAREMEMSGELFLFSIFSFLYLMWAMVPLGIGGASRFDPGRLLIYPISLPRLFAIDMVSELTSLSSIFAVPVMVAIGIGAGLANGRILTALLVALCAISFGVTLAKWLAASVGALMQKRRTRGETVLALIGAVVGLAGAFLGQLAPVIMRHAESFRSLWWTPPGAAAIALTEGLRAGGAGAYLLAVTTLLAYTFALVALTYFIARRSALGMGGAKRAAIHATPHTQGALYVGWQLPFLSAELSAIVEKELRYAMRNAQLRTMALMPLILVGVRLAQTSGLRRRSALPPVAGSFTEAFATYGDGLMPALGMLYVFMILSALACNLFGYEGSGMRALVLSPLDRKTILIGKNITVTLIAFVFTTVLMIVNELVFRDLSWHALVFTALCFMLFATLFALVGNWLSIRFPKRLKFGKRMNASGVTGFLLIPILILMACVPVAAAFAGYLTQSLAVKYATLIAFVIAAATLYYALIGRQGRALARYEIEILETVTGRSDEI